MTFWMVGFRTKVGTLTTTTTLCPLRYTDFTNGYYQEIYPIEVL